MRYRSDAIWGVAHGLLFVAFFLGVPLYCDHLDRRQVKDDLVREDLLFDDMYKDALIVGVFEYRVQGSWVPRHEDHVRAAAGFRVAEKLIRDNGWQVTKVDYRGVKTIAKR